MLPTCDGIAGQSGQRARRKKPEPEMGGHTSLKSPLRSAREGTPWLKFGCWSLGEFSILNSSEKNTNVFPLRIGPPMVPPKSFLLYFGALVVWSKKLRALKYSLRMNSYAFPCQLSPPVFVVTITVPEAVRPYCAP